MRSVNYVLISFFIGFLNSCAANEVGTMNNINKEERLNFTCTKEADHLPLLDPQADLWFKQARAMEKANGPKDFAAIGSLYRQAIAKDHYKAMRNLQNLLLEGLVPPAVGKTAGEEAVEIVERMIKLNIPAGYYAMGYYLENGYGVKPDKMASLSYYRKAADLGNPEGQQAIGTLLFSQQLPDGQNNPAYHPDIGKSMLDCAANQGYADAAYWLGMITKAQKNFPASIKYFQLAVRNGHSLATLQLRDSFNASESTNQLDYLGLSKDLERSRRYELIADEIDRNSSARFPDIDKIVPLPPAPLPEWDGTFEYKKQPDQ